MLLWLEVFDGNIVPVLGGSRFFSIISGFESCDRFLSRNFKTKLLIESGVENGVENGVEEDSKLENSSLLGHD